MPVPHELASIFPPMDADQYEDLRRDIATNGLLEPITLYEKKILDGVNRERACKETKTKARYTTYDGDDPQGFVVSRNLHRRHLTVAQRADIAVKLLPPDGRGGDRSKTPDPGFSSGAATERAAAAVGLGKTTVEAAKKIKKEDPDLWKETVAGKHTVDGAARKLRGQSAPKAPSRPKRTESWNGKTNPKRNRELHQKRREGNYAALVATQLRINQLCSALEATELEDFGLDTANLAVVADIHDDLLTLAEWVDRKLHHVGAWLNDVEVRDKIRRLRDTRGRTEEEAETALRLADRLERKLEARLVSVTG